jgi:hypothetical protein
MLKDSERFERRLCTPLLLLRAETTGFAPSSVRTKKGDPLRVDGFALSAVACSDAVPAIGRGAHRLVTDPRLVRIQVGVLSRAAPPHQARH